MAKRKVVPVALHSELSEYSSLLRALRTENTLDIVSHLTKDHSSVSPYDKGDETDEDSPSNTSRTPVEGSSRGPTRSVSPKSGETRNGPSTQTTGDTWTRWPMLAGDVHVPEWSFQDEVKLLAIQALQQQRKSGSEGDQSPSDEEVKEEDIFDSSFLNALTVASSTHLSQILSLLAAHIPQAEKSMQNRIKPLRWENVLDIMATSGFVDEKSVHPVYSLLWYIQFIL
ncbi:hypothetical protein SERLA73DRAFT_134281 [Serpula lacrymans var. lacrymans S7.3]|uniref:Uncharacterized protein n=1 Tax=Serpula lacrymans var. lacrymans (strain S7.3) TaxID=936435 RepID=F8PTT2_SERL3|nr:hypothetical protein SERLA73DRAFT_134281 [Serpula lacrymans var. lacrymans S7.3]